MDQTISTPKDVAEIITELAQDHHIVETEIIDAIIEEPAPQEEETAAPAEETSASADKEDAVVEEQTTDQEDVSETHEEDIPAEPVKEEEKPEISAEDVEEADLAPEMDLTDNNVQPKSRKLTQKEKEHEWFAIVANAKTTYENQETKFNEYMQISLYAKAAFLALIPIVSIFNFHHGILTILLVCAVVFSEYIIKYNKYDEQKLILNKTITSLNQEYYDYHFDMGEYAALSLDEQNKLFMEHTYRTIKEADQQLNLECHTDSSQNIKFIPKS